MNQSRMKRRRPKRSHGGIVWAVIAVALVAAVIGALIFSLNRKPDPADSVSTSKSSSSNVASSKSSSFSESSKSSQTSSSESRTTDVQQFNSLSGSYQAMNGMMSSLDFNTREARTWLDNGRENNVGQIDDVLKHSDGSLIIHVHFQDSDGTTSYYAYLFVPADVSLEKNWQTGASLTDRTSTTRARFSPGISKDGGQNYDLSLAYKSFSMSSPERSQYGMVLYYRN